MYTNYIIEDTVSVKNVEIERYKDILDFYIRRTHIKQLNFALCLNPCMGRISLENISVRDKGFAHLLAEFLKSIFEKFYGMVIDNKTIIDMMQMNVIQYFRQLYRVNNVTCIVNENYENIKLNFTVNFG